MMRSARRVRALAYGLVVLTAGCGERGPDLSKEPTLYVVGYARLDTQWRWEYPEVIGSLIPATMHDNFALFEKYRRYVFNFSGANRYRMMKECYPADFERVRRYVAEGRWFPSGSAMEESDVNVPSAEALIRQILYGSRFFRDELGRTSAEYMLRDCFGFPASLPSILAHSGITGFSTQALTWKSAAGIPFNVGAWEGLDGSSVIAALNPGSYGGDIREDLSASSDWIDRIATAGAQHGVYADYHYYGTGDRGGAPDERSVALLEQIVERGSAVLSAPDEPGQPRQEPPDTGTPVPVGNGPLHVRSATAEDMFRDITPARADALPRYRGDLLLIEHSAGSITSQAYMKRWNHANEKLADAAERASVAAAWLGGRSYPRERLNGAWTLVMGGQFHDILPGTSTPKAYEYSWNDEVLALNQFAGVLTSATDAVAGALETDVPGTPVVVCNSLAVDREDVAEATVTFPDGVPAAVRVVGPDGGCRGALAAGPGERRRWYRALRGARAVGRLRRLRRASGGRHTRLGADRDAVFARERPLPSDARQERRRGERVRQVAGPRAALGAAPAGPAAREARAVAGVEHGLGRSAEAAARVRARSGPGARRRAGPGARRPRGRA